MSENQAETAQAISDRITSNWDSLPEQKNLPLSLRAIVLALYPSIESLIRRGYTYSDIAHLIAEQGILIRVPTLRKYHVENRFFQSLQKTCDEARSKTKTQIQSALKTLPYSLPRTTNGFKPN